jgi:hypothetical protein
MINCAKCEVSATEVYVFQMSAPFFERPRVFLCDKCGGHSSLESVHRAKKVHDSLVNCMVKLTNDEINYCRINAKLRGEDSRNYKSQRVAVGRTDEDIDFTGLLGEVACMKFFGFPTHATLGTFRAADLPHNIEVRTRTAMWHDCKVRPDDDDSRRVVMAIATGPNAPVKIAGWITAFEGKKFKLIDPRQADRNFHAVPQKNLRLIEELKEIIEQEKKISSHNEVGGVSKTLQRKTKQ